MTVFLRRYASVAGFAVLVLNACAEKRKDPPPAPVTFKSTHFPYSVAYDLNRWRTLAPGEAQIVMANADALFADAAAQHFMAIAADHSNRSLAELRTAALIALQQKGPNLQVEMQSPITIAGAPGLLLQLEATIREQPIAFELAFVQYGGIAYQLSYWSASDSFLEREPDFRDFIASFRPRAVSAAPSDNMVAYPSPKSGYILTLPAPEWSPSRERLSEDADQQFQNQSALAFVMVIAERMPLGLNQLVQRGLARMRESSQGRFRPTETVEIMADGVPAKIVYGDVAVEGIVYKYAIFFSSHAGIVYQIAAWSPADLYEERYKKQFNDLFKTTQFFDDLPQPSRAPVEFQK